LGERRWPEDFELLPERRRPEELLRRDVLLSSELRERPEDEPRLEFSILFSFSGWVGVALQEALQIFSSS